MVEKKRSGARTTEMKVIYQGNHWTEGHGTTAKEDESALRERICLETLDKQADTLRTQGGFNLYLSQSRVGQDQK